MIQGTSLGNVRLKCALQIRNVMMKMIESLWIALLEKPGNFIHLINTRRYEYAASGEIGLYIDMFQRDYGTLRERIKQIQRLRIRCQLLRVTGFCHGLSKR